MDEQPDGEGAVSLDYEAHVDAEILDEVLTVLGDGVPEGLLRACDLFRSGIPTRLDDIAAALADGRHDTVAAVAHSVRGSAGAFGARRLSLLADRLEHLEPGHDEAAQALLDDMRAEFVLFRAILDARIEELSG